MPGPLTRPAPDANRVALLVAARLAIRVILFAVAVVAAYLVLSTLDRPAHADSGTAPAGQPGSAGKQVTDLVPPAATGVVAPALPPDPNPPPPLAPPAPAPAPLPVLPPPLRPPTVPAPPALPAQPLALTALPTQPLNLATNAVTRPLTGAVSNAVTALPNVGAGLQTATRLPAVDASLLAAPNKVVQQTLPAAPDDQGVVGTVAGLLPVAAAPAPSTSTAPAWTIGAQPAPNRVVRTTDPVIDRPGTPTDGPVFRPAGGGGGPAGSPGRVARSTPTPLTPPPHPVQAPDALTFGQLGGSGINAAPVHATIAAGWGNSLACCGGVAPTNANGRGGFVRHGRLPG